MRILIINGSPRPEGLVGQMLALMVDEARTIGHQVDTVQISRLAVHPCMGCMACRSRRACILPEDGAQHVLNLLRECDVLIIGSPSYWGNLTGGLKVLLDRLVYGFIEEGLRGLPRPLHEGKKAILLTACSTPWLLSYLTGQTRGVVRALRTVLRWSGFAVWAVVERSGTRQYPRLTDKDRARCRRIIGRITR